MACLFCVYFDINAESNQTISFHHHFISFLELFSVQPIKVILDVLRKDRCDYFQHLNHSGEGRHRSAAVGNKKEIHTGH